MSENKRKTVASKAEGRIEKTREKERQRERGRRRLLGSRVMAAKWRQSSSSFYLFVLLLLQFPR